MMLLPVLVLLAVASMALLSSLYASAAEDLTRHTLGRADTSEAATLAARLAPWRSFAHLQVAQSQSARGDLAAAQQAAERAAAGAPSDGRAWAYLARLRGARPRYDPNLAAHYRMALAQAPQAPDVRGSIAVDGALRWRHGDEELRVLWRDSMRYALRRDRHGFLLRIVRLGRDPYWCAEHSTALPIARWCTQMQQLRQRCRAAKGISEAEAWCRNAGIDPGAP